MMNTPGANNAAVRRFVWILSIAVPLLVTALFLIPPAEGLSEDTLRRVYMLPRLNALLNGCAFLCLAFSLKSIRSGQVTRHRNLNTAALALSALFLLSYVTFHMLTESTRFGGEGAIRYLYFSILISHILMSAVIVPLALFSYARGLAGDIEKHRRIAKVTMPMWLYVTATGVIVFWMISPYYPY
jgi:putative membrane protein